MRTVKFSDQTMESEDHHRDFHEIELGVEPMSNVAGVGGGRDVISQQQQADEGDHHVITMRIHQGGSLPLPVIKEAAGNNDLDEDDSKALLASRMERKKSFVANVVRSVVKMKRLAAFSSKKVPPEGGAAPHHYRSNSVVILALEGLKFINNKTNAWESEVEELFGKLTAFSNGMLHRSLFAKCIGMENEFAPCAEKLFDAIAKREKIKGDSVDKPQLKKIWSKISDPSFDSRLRTFFDMAHDDADRRITKREIEEIFYHTAAAMKLLTIQQKASEYATLIMEVLDPTDTKFTTLEKLEEVLLRQPPPPPKREERKDLGWYKNTKYFLQENWKRIWVLALWIFVMAGLFSYKFIQYRRRAAYEVMGYCVCFAKGAAETLKLNMAITLLPVCRNTITWLRNKKFGTIVPLDDSLNFHKGIIPWAVAIGVGIHAGCHLACDFPRLLHASSEKYKLMEPFFGPQPSNYWHYVKSFEGVTGIGMVFLMAILFTFGLCWSYREEISKKLPKPFNKLTASFNKVFYAHFLLLFVYGLLIMHGIKLYLTKEWYKKTTWMYLAIPISIYLFERLYRKLRSSKVSVTKVVYYAGEVLTIRMSKPKRFKYKSGQYMFVKCPDVSPFEWHPFSITSAPDDDYLSVHIKREGDWTGSLIEKFKQACHEATAGKSGIVRAERMSGDISPSIFPKVLIDGPHGAPAQEYKKYEVVLLIGLGIGATPMISIIKDIVNNYKAKKEEVTTSTPQNKMKKSNFKTRKAYFYWVAEKQDIFDCFKGVMKEVAEEDQGEVIELHTHFTKAYEYDKKGDDPSPLSPMLQSLYYAKHGVDAVTDTRVLPHFGRPDWHTVYTRIAQDYKRFQAANNNTHSQQNKKHEPQPRVGVFLCGKPTAAKQLLELALDFSRNKTIGIKFEFHMENFY